MQFKLATTILAAATLAAATVTPVKRWGASPEDQCNTGDLLCCNTVQSADSALAAGLLGLVGAVVGDVTASVGITCNPVSVIAIGGNSCSAQPVCCTDNSFNGVVALGCSPINANL